MVAKALNKHNCRDAEPCEKALAGVVPRFKLELAQTLAGEGMNEKGYEGVR